MIKPADISLCAIYRNEEKLLPDFLDHHQGLFGELVLLDTGSRDRSVEIVTKRGLAHHSFPWNDHFSQARNHGLSLARKPYICVLDIDEVLLPSGLEQAADLLTPGETDGLSLCQINLGLQPQSGESFDSGRLPTPFHLMADRYSISRLIRIFPRNPRVRFQGAIHEIVGESLHAAGYRSKITDIPIYHLGWALNSRSPEEQAAKQTRYQAIIRKAFTEEPTVQNGYYLLTTVYSPAERLRLTYDLTRRFPDIQDFAVMMAQCAVEMEEWPRALDYIRRGQMRFPDSDTLHLLELQVLNQMGRPEETLVRLNKHREHLQHHPKARIEDIKALIMLGRRDEARRQLTSHADSLDPEIRLALEKLLQP